MTGYKDQLPGGIGDETGPADVDAEQLRMGIKVELEHTGDRLLATEIALDHLTEDPEYYTKLARIEPHHGEVERDERELTYIEGDELVRAIEGVADLLFERGAAELGGQVLGWLATARGM